MGNDKAPMDDRAKFSEEHLPEVFDSADKPLDGKGWWLGADSPWQALAACRELSNAMRSGDPEGYKCHLPVHQDGSCNGLQHYAALGRDLAGAEAVNLVDADRPQDVYSKVLELVLKRIEADSTADLSSPSRLRKNAKSSEGGFASPLAEARTALELARKAQVLVELGTVADGSKAQTEEAQLK